MIRYAFVIGAFVTAAMLFQSGTRAVEMGMRFPPASIDQNERVLSVNEITALPCTGIARATVERIVKRSGAGWTVDMAGETVSHNDEFGFVYRYRVIYAFEENGKNYSVDSIYVVWSKDGESIGVASFPTFKLPGSLD